MSTVLIAYNPLYIRLGIGFLALLLVAGFLILSRRSRKKQRRAPDDVAGEPPARPGLFAHYSRPGSTLLADIMRGVLILLAVCVAVGLILIALPEGTIDGMAQSLRLRHGELPQQEPIALLYLGDEGNGKEFHVRGVIRNISTVPIENLDAAVRLYAPDGTLTETTIVRMDSEVIAPDATSTFHLKYMDYDGRFGSYSVDFRLRSGETVPYKDLRENQTGF
jgi:hypothetical protein